MHTKCGAVPATFAQAWALKERQNTLASLSLLPHAAVGIICSICIHGEPREELSYIPATPANISAANSPGLCLTRRVREGSLCANFISAELADALIKIDVLRRENDAGQLARKLAACLLIYERHFEPIALARWHRERRIRKKWHVKRLFVSIQGSFGNLFAHQHSFKVKFASPFSSRPFREGKKLKII